MSYRPSPKVESRLKSLSVYVEAAVVALVVAYGAGTFGQWARARVNSKVHADERCAVAQERMADAWERLANKAAPLRKP